MMPHWLDLKYFLAVAECKNISRASEILGISQPSLSLAIKRLEDIAQVKLFVRKKNGVDLTREGVAFKERSADLLELWQSISDDVKRSSHEVSGRYIFGAHISVALARFIPVLHAVMKNYPKLELSFRHGWSRIITDQVIGYDIDFAMVVNPTPHPDLVISEICRDRVGFFAHQDRRESDVLIYDPDLLQSQALLKIARASGLNFKRTITSNSLEFIAKLTEIGIGIGLLPERVVNELKNPQIALLHDELPQFQDRHCLIYRVDAQKTKSQRMLASELKRLLIASVEI